MPKVNYVTHGGERRTVEVEAGLTLMEAAIRNDVEGIEGECGGACACATCHVYVDLAWLSRVGTAEGAEVDMLEFAYDVQPNSRLSCQIEMRPDLDGVVVKTPLRQGY